MGPASWSEMCEDPRKTSLMLCDKFSSDINA